MPNIDISQFYPGATLDTDNNRVSFPMESGLSNIQMAFIICQQLEALVRDKQYDGTAPFSGSEERSQASLVTRGLGNGETYQVEQNLGLYHYHDMAPLTAATLVTALKYRSTGYKGLESQGMAPVVQVAAEETLLSRKLTTPETYQYHSAAPGGGTITADFATELPHGIIKERTPGDSLTIYVTLEKAAKLSRIVHEGGQWNGDYNLPPLVQLFTGHSTDQENLVSDIPLAYTETTFTIDQSEFAAPTDRFTLMYHHDDSGATSLKQLKIYGYLTI